MTKEYMWMLTKCNASVGDPSKIRPYSSLTGLLLSLCSLTAFSFRKPKNKRKAEQLHKEDCLKM